MHRWEHRQPVLHEHHVLDAQDAPHADVLVHFAAGALHPREPGHVTQNLDRTPRRGLHEVRGAQDRRRVAGLELGARALGSGHDHRLEVQRVGREREVLGGRPAGGHGDRLGLTAVADETHP